MKIYRRKAVFDDLSKYDVLAHEGEWIEVVEWSNGEGFDVEIYTHGETKRIGLTFGELMAIKKLVKKLDSDEQDSD